MGEQKTMPVVYICSPYLGEIEANVANARIYSRNAALMGYVPIAPHLLFPQFISEKNERELAIQMDLELLSHCDELWVCGDFLSAGMKKEVEEATRLRKSIRYFRLEHREINGQKIGRFVEKVRKGRDQKCF